MSNVKGTEATCGDRNEFVEIYNQSADTIDLINHFIYDFDANPDEICPWENEEILINNPGARIHSTLIYPYTYAVVLDSEYCSVDTTGGNVQPYDFPDSTLILKTDDSTIGNGIQNNDPLIIYSEVDACTTSFGTPYDTLDNFPHDPGDGISWERIDLSMPDDSSNWHTSLDTAGCTPGRENSTTVSYDLALVEQSILFTPAILKVGEDVEIEVRVKNLGLRQTDDYDLSIFDDEDADSIIDTNELITTIDGEMVNPSDSVAFFYMYENPSQGTHNLGFQIDCLYDQNLDNNLVFKILSVLGEIGELSLSPDIFTPNNDGIDDNLQIDFRLPESGGNLTISVYDSRGRLIHNICKNETCATERGTIFWDGNTSKGKTPTGMYIVYLEYQYSNKLTKAKKTTVLARY